MRLLTLLFAVLVSVAACGADDAGLTVDETAESDASTDDGERGDGGGASSDGGTDVDGSGQDDAVTPEQAAVEEAEEQLVLEDESDVDPIEARRLTLDFFANGYGVELTAEQIACVEDEGLLTVEVEPNYESILPLVLLQACAGDEMVEGLVSAIAVGTELTDEQLENVRCLSAESIAAQDGFTLQERLETLAGGQEIDDDVAGACGLTVDEARALQAEVNG